MDWLRGGEAGDVLIGAAGDDVLVGGGGDDRFVFSVGDERDRIVDFSAGVSGGDVIDLSGYLNFNDFASVQANATQVGANTEITLEGGDQITLLGVNTFELVQDDFLF